MNEEEKKAIEICKEIDTCDLLNCWSGGGEEYDALQILLNLIEKQQTKIDKAIEYIGIDEELEKCCDMYDVNGIDLLRILKGEQ